MASAFKIGYFSFQVFCIEKISGFSPSKTGWEGGVQSEGCRYEGFTLEFVLLHRDSTGLGEFSPPKLNASRADQNNPSSLFSA